MPRKAEVDRPVKQIFSMPESVHAWMHLHLFSELERRVPKGAIQEFLLARIREYRETAYLDLHPYVVNLEPGAFTVRGSKEAVAMLKRRLENG